jgi:hypothetical protein
VIASSNSQTLQFDSLVAGETYLLVVTNSPGAFAIQFKHLDDPVVRVLPSHARVTGVTAVTTFVCPSPKMALYWETAPSFANGRYYVTLTPLTQKEF